MDHPVTCRHDRGVSTERSRHVRTGWRAVALLAVGLVLVLAGVALHGVAVAHRPSGPGGSDTWEVLVDHAALRWAAYGAVVGGVVLVVRGWSLRRR